MHENRIVVRSVIDLVLDIHLNDDFVKQSLGAEEMIDYAKFVHFKVVCKIH